MKATLTLPFLIDEDNPVRSLAALYQKGSTVEQLAEHAVPPQWMVHSLLPRGSLLLVAGPPKAKKTFLMLDLLLHLRTGKPFLNLATKRSFVVYANLEDGANRVGWRLKGFLASSLDKVQEQKNALVFTNPDDLPEILGHLKVLAKAHPKTPFVLIIDTLARLGACNGLTNENDAMEMTRLLDPYRDYAQETGVSILLVHHFRKDGQRMRGSSALEGAVDGWWNVHPAEDDCQLINITVRDSGLSQIGTQIHFEPDNRVWVETLDPSDVMPLSNPWAIKGETNKQKLEEKVSKYLKMKKNEFVPSKDIAKDLKMRKKTALTVLNSLTEEELVEKKPKAGWKWVG